MAFGLMVERSPALYGALANVQQEEE